MQARSRGFEAEEALQAAMLLFWRQGYHATSAEDLVRATGLSRSSLYGAFGGKPDLFAAALRRYRREQSAGLIAALAGEGPLRPAIEQVFRATVAAARADDGAGCLIVNTATEFGAADAGIAAIVRDNVTEVLDALTTAIGRAQDRGEIGAQHSAQALASFLFHQLTALKVTAKIVTDDRCLDDAIAVAMSILERE
jgi:TetR/AcrR family transcriptional repressor of nem operon